jgi:hypothetical protein
LTKLYLCVIIQLIQQYLGRQTMLGIKKFRLFTTLQKERVKVIEARVISWMNDLQPGEQLVVGLPQVLGNWNECTPLVVGQGMQDQFLGWLSENSAEIEGPVYNLPTLTAGFLCIIIDEDFDPRIENPDSDAPKELKGVLIALGNFMTQSASEAA